jgi:ankyrin repeat protein
MKNITTFLLLFLITTSYSQKIFESLENKNHNNLEIALKNGEKTEVYNQKGLTPIWLSVFKNDTVSLNLLIKYGADINFLEKKGMHPIMVGCIANSFESVKILLEKGVDVNWKSKSSRNQQAIRFASQRGSLKLVKLLLKYGADMESTPDDKATPLLASLHAKNYEVAKFYFFKDANVNVIGRDGECVIHEAIKTKNPEMVKLALKYKAPLNLKDKEGMTTWKIAKRSENSEIKKLMKEALKEN